MNVEFQIFAQSPVDILRLILQCITMEEICVLDTAMMKHSSRLVFLESLKGLKLFDIDRIARTPGAIQWLLKRRIAVTNLTIQPLDGFQNYDVSVEICANLFFQNKDSLVSINLNGCKFFDSFFLILNSCRNLTSIHLEGCHTITDEGIRNLLNSQPPLLSLNLSKCSLLTAESIKIISQTCHKIQSLAISNNSFVTDNQISEIIQGCPHIRSLELANTRITDVSITALLQAYPNIELIDIGGSFLVSSAGKLTLLRAFALQHLRSQDPRTQLISARAIRRFLSDGNFRIMLIHLDLQLDVPPIDEVISLGVVPTLVQFLQKDESPILQFEVSWSLTNIASGTILQTQPVIDEGAIPQFVRLLSSSNIDLVEQVAWALGNIAAGSIFHRDLVLSFGALQSLATCQLTTPTAIRTASRTISNLCRQPISSIENLIVLIFPFLKSHLSSNDSEVLVHVCYAIRSISDEKENKIQMIQRLLDAELLSPIVTILGTCQDNRLRSSTLRIVGNILMGDDNQTQAVLDLGILPIFSTLLDHPDNSIKKEVCWSLSNIAAGNNSQVQLLLNCQILSTLLSQFHSYPTDVIKECLWIFRNATKTMNSLQIQTLIDQGILPFLSWSLSSSPSPLMRLMLEIIFVILQSNESFHQSVREAIGSQLQNLKSSGDLENVDILSPIFVMLKWSPSTTERRSQGE